MFEKRENEPEYALLNDPSCQAFNVYGDSIDTVLEDDCRRDQSLNINNDEAIGDNPNRYKQHGFYFMRTTVLPAMPVKLHAVKKTITLHIFHFDLLAS